VVVTSNRADKRLKNPINGRIWGMTDTISLA